MKPRMPPGPATTPIPLDLSIRWPATTPLPPEMRPTVETPWGRIRVGKGEPLKRKPGGGQKAPVDERFAAKVEAVGTCWLWIGAVDDCGYGQFGPNGAPSCMKAHRWAWMRANGAIPPGFDLDHLCRNRRCVRPSHLEPVTHVENAKRASRYHSLGPLFVREAQR